MKTSLLLCLMIAALFIISCGNSDTATDMPDNGYKERSDSASADDTIADVKDKAAVGVDTIKNGQAVISGATSDSSK